jgi:hypothetical protein
VVSAQGRGDPTNGSGQVAADQRFSDEFLFLVALIAVLNWQAGLKK